MQLNTTKILLGVILIFVGLSTLLNQFNLFNNFRPWDFWPLILIAIGLTQLQKRSYFAGGIVIALGIAFLLSNFYGYSVFGIFWPIIIISIGLSILFKPFSTKINNSNSNYTENKINDTILFWGMDRKVQSDNFIGGKIDCMFGGFKLDLREIKITQDAILEINCAFGGGEIWVDKNMRVESQGTAIFGGWENKFSTNQDNNQPVLKITGNVLFGGVEIKS